MRAFTNALTLTTILRIFRIFQTIIDEPTMKKPYIPFVAFLILLILTMPFSFDFAASVVPGWHYNHIAIKFCLGTVSSRYFSICVYWILVVIKASEQNQHGIIWDSHNDDNTNCNLPEIPHHYFAYAADESLCVDRRSYIEN